MKSYWFWSIFSCCLFRACSLNVLFNCPYNVWFSTRINAEPVDLCQESRKELRHWTALFSIWRLCEILLLYLHPAPFNATIWCLEDTQHLLKDFLSRSKIIYMPNLVQKMYLSFAVWYIVFLYRIWMCFVSDMRIILWKIWGRVTCWGNVHNKNGACVVHDFFSTITYITYIAHLRQVFQLKIWHFWIIGRERNVCRCTFNRYSVVMQFAKLAAGEQLCRRCTYTKL